MHVVELRGPEGSTITRLPGQVPPATACDYTSTLRRDAEAVPLLSIIRLEAGLEAALLLDIRGDGIPTLRTTTPIVSIEAAG
ncbi:hypothetical protein GCM10028789_27050 [Sinomonas halotolerans]